MDNSCAFLDAASRVQEQYLNYVTSAARKERNGRFLLFPLLPVFQRPVSVTLPPVFLVFLSAPINSHSDYDGRVALAINPREVRGSYVIHERRVNARSALIYL